MNQEATQYLRNRIPRRKKPHARQPKFICTGRRLANWRAYINIDFYDIRTLIEQRDRHDKYGRERAFLGFRPGVVYCPECGRRMNWTTAVLKWRDDDYLACRTCTEARGHKVWTASELATIPGGAAAYTAYGVRYYQ